MATNSSHDGDAAPEPLPRSRVLIVDDNTATAALVARHLGHHDIDTHCVSDGASALAVVRACLPDLVLLDANLPDMDGIEVCRTIKADTALAGTLVAFLSAERTGPRHRVEGLNVGADAYLTHPIDEAELVAKVRSLLRLRHAELSARDSRDLYRDLLDAAPIGIAHLALDGVVVTANRALAGILAAEPEQLAGRHFDAFLHPDERTAMRVAFTAISTGRRAPVTREIRLLTAGGATAWAVLSSRLHFQPDGAPSHLIIALEDITARKVAEAAVRECDHLLHELYEVSHDLIATVAPDGCIIEANSAFHRALALERGALRDKPVEVFLAPAHRAAWHASLRRVAGGAGDELFRGSLLGTSQATVHVEGSLARRDAPSGVALRLILHDVTEHRRLEEQTLRNQRLDSIGTLAGGIAHDLNNVLAPIFLSLDLLRGDAGEAERAGYLDSIERSARRASDLVRQVLLFARGGSGEKSVLEPAVLLRDLARMLRETFPKNIEIECGLDEASDCEIGTLHANPTQLTQVLLNLCLNARDAMPSGGCLTVRASATEITVEEAAIHPGAVAGPALVLSVSDTGCGIPADVQARVFDPFFTTKEVGKGTGLGLPTALGIVRGHGGFMAFHSDPATGTTFEVTLPAVLASAAPLQTGADAPRPRGHGELVLVIDDERILRQAAESVLHAHGYRVLLAADGPEGIAQASAFSGELRLVLTDLMMPRLDGFATAAALQQVVPGVPVIAMTGHAGAEIEDRLRDAGITRLIAKPFEPGEMLVAIDEALRGRRPAPVSRRAGAALKFSPS